MYRNKSQVPFETKRGLNYDFYRAHSHDISLFETCCIQNDEINKIIAFTRSFYISNEVEAKDLDMS